MAQFGTLNDAGRAIASHLRRNLSPPLNDVIAAPPHDGQTAPPESIRVTLLWITPQPVHRSDPWVTGTDGQSRPPPVTLSGYYLVTCYGTSDEGETVQAVNLLGQTVQIIETEPVIEMPLLASGPIDAVPGEGRMSLTLVPTAADLMEKVFTPLQLRHRPWALFEAGPIQLRRLLDPEPGPEIVYPGGVMLAGPRPIAPPAISSLAPQRVRPGGRIRLDTAGAGNAQSLRIGRVTFTFASPRSGPLDIAPPDAEGRVFATYPAAGPSGDVDAVIRMQDLNSPPMPLTIAGAGSAGVDAPVAPLAAGAPLILTGAGLAASERLFLWPDRGIRAPAEVIEIVPDTVAAAQVRIEAATFAAAGLTRGRYRAALRLSATVFTPYVILEVAP